MRKSERQSIVSTAKQMTKDAWQNARDGFDFLIVAVCVVALVSCWVAGCFDELED